jgi:hypothetical protein
LNLQCLAAFGLQPSAIPFCHTPIHDRSRVAPFARYISPLERLAVGFGQDSAFGFQHFWHSNCQSTHHNQSKTGQGIFGRSRGHDFSIGAYGFIVGNRTRVSGVTTQRPKLLDDNEHKKVGLVYIAKPTKNWFTWDQVLTSGKYRLALT